MPEANTKKPGDSVLLSWRNQSLAVRFALAGGVVMIISSLLIGQFITRWIETGVVRNTALATSQYMDSIISPLSQDMADADELSPGARRAIEEIFVNTALGQRVVSFKLWKSDGLIVEATDPSIVGQRFAVTEDLAAAFNGEIRADFGLLDDKDNHGGADTGVPLLEVYSPIRAVWSGEIIGVAEFYESGTELERDLALARRNSWLAVVSVLSTIGAMLFLIVLQGSRTIDRQRAVLTDQLGELGALSTHNQALRARVQQAAARSSAMNDHTLRRIGADLHDGAAQLLSFAALRLDALGGRLRDETELTDISRAVKDAIIEVRRVSRGLSLPNIDSRSACQILADVVEAHRARTGMHAELHCTSTDAVDLPEAVKICIYRFAQEGLNNSWRYAGDGIATVSFSCDGKRAVLNVTDTGPGFANRTQLQQDGDFQGMGLAGLRDRVESLGGVFLAQNLPNGTGAEIRMELELEVPQWRKSES